MNKQKEKQKKKYKQKKKEEKRKQKQARPKDGQKNRLEIEKKTYPRCNKKNWIYSLKKKLSENLNRKEFLIVTNSFYYS